MFAHFSREMTPSSSVVVKSCACGNQIQFDPIQELGRAGLLGSLSASLSTVHDYDSDYGSYDRKTKKLEMDSNAGGIFFAKQIEITDNDDAETGTGNKTPPRPPPPSNYSGWFYSTLPRKQARNSFAKSQNRDSSDLQRSQSFNQYDPERN